VQVDLAKPADSFVDSIGVTAHVRYSDRAYWNYNGILKPRLLESGIRHLRADVQEGWTRPIVMQRLKDLGKSGIKLNLVASPWNGSPENARRNAIELKDMLISVEGPNEWDERNPVRYRQEAFPKGLELFQGDLYQAIKSENQLKNIPVIAPSGFYYENFKSLEQLQMPCDYGNMHSYPGGQPPTTPRLTTVFTHWAKQICPDKPVMATETGYYTATNNLNDPWHTPVSEKGGGRYINRLLFDYFNRGIRRTYLYELIDQGSDDDRESRFGLIRENGTPKLAFTAVRNTIALLKDPGGTFIPNALSYTIQSPSSVKRTILQKRDGRFYMVLWNDVVSYNAPQKKDIEPIWQEVTLTFPEAYESVNIYRPIESTRPMNSYSNLKTLKVLVPDFPVVVELRS
jgi:hypothetical protein